MGITRKFITILLAIFLSLIIVACGDIENTEKSVVGDNLIDSNIINEVSAQTNLAYIKGSIDENATNSFSYKSIKIIYMTKNEQDEDIKASGVLTIPTPTPQYVQYLKSLGKSFSISLIVENHGTIFLNIEAPSNEISTFQSNTQKLATLMSGFAGFAVAIPDYIGYGDSKGVNHPYILNKSSARVSIDMLKASTKYLIDNNIVSNGQVYISGYSEGGYIAMATAQELEKNFSSEFQLKGVAPMAGPYDVKALGNIEINATHLMQYPAFLGYLASSYAMTYDDINLNDVLNTSVNRSTYDMLFNGSYSNVQIHGALDMVTDTNASTPQGKGFQEYNASKLFDTSFISDYQDTQTNAFKVRLEENSVYDWSPKAKMNLIHCVTDEIIPYTMTTTAYNKFKENLGSEKTLTKTLIPASYITRTGLFMHGDCASTAYGAAVKWFAGIRSGEIK